MSDSSKDARAVLQDRVGKVVWGLALIAGGVLLTLDNRGIIELHRYKPFPAEHVTDGDLGTRWSSRWRDGQWITVDLGAPAAISKVRLHWEKAYASSYDVAVSDDANTWTTVALVRGGDGGLDEHAVSTSGRYVRMTGHERAPVEEGRKRKRKRYGVSLWELEVLGADAQPISHGKVATASSIEGTHLWRVYWPVLIILGGLPCLLVPKNSNDLTFGVMAVVVGAAFQLRMLDLLKFRTWDMIPLFLVIGGLLLILQAVAYKNGGRGAGAAEGAR